MIGKLNRRITIRSWTSSKDDGGGPVAVQTGSYSIWAEVKPRTGQRFSDTDQMLWSYDYKVKFRYEASRVVGSNMTIDYDNKRLAINSIEFEDEGTRKYCIARCTTTDQSIDNSGNGANVPFRANVYEYIGVGDESSFTVSTLKNKTIILAHKDGVQYRVILSGTPVDKQVKYTASTGGFEWSDPFQPTVFAQITYL